jgi:ABC-type branched-subunit amino acid transport system substrate-binding protein
MPIPPAPPPGAVVPPSPGAAVAVPAGAKRRVALLLPLSGNSAALGRALLDAAQLAVFDMGDESFALLPRDTGGTPDGAVRAAEAALNDGAGLLLGPLFGAEAQAVAPVARARGINVISLSNDRAIAQPGIFAFGLTPQVQVERIVEFARSRGLQRFAGLIPANAYGDAVEDAFRRTVTRNGGELVLIERYDAAGDLGQAVRRLADAEIRRSARLDALLLPDFGDRLLAVAPLLPYYDVDPSKIRFLGNALWEDPRLGREPALTGAWFAAPTPAARADFTRRYNEVYGRPPPRLATLAYDAVAMAAFLARKPGGDLSIGALTNPDGFAGLDGIFRLLPDGITQRGLAVLEMRRDNFPVISPAPTTFQVPTQ